MRLNKFLLTTAVATSLSFGAAAPAFAQDAAENVENGKDTSPFPENPARSDAALELQRLRAEGVAHYEAGLALEAAKDRFKRAYAQSGAADDAFNVALVAFRENENATMAEWLDKALAADPNHPNSNYLKGLAARQDGLFKEARDFWLKTVAAEPKDAQLHYQLALVSRSLGDDPAFLQGLINALNLDPNHPGALYQMFRHYRTSGSVEAATSTMKRFTAVKRMERFSRREKQKEPSGLTLPIGGTRADADPFDASDVALEAGAIAVACDWTNMFVLVEPVDKDGVDEVLVGRCHDGRVLYGDTAREDTVDLGRLPEGAADARLESLDTEGPRLIVSAGGRLMASDPIVGKAHVTAPAPLAWTDLGPMAGGFTLVDLDADGDLDAVPYDGSLPLTNAGELTFKPEKRVYADSPLLAVMNGADQALAVDIARAGTADVAVLAAGELRLSAGDVLGFVDAWRVATGLEEPEALHVADLDHNGQIDLLVQGADGAAMFWNVSRTQAPGEPDMLVEAGEQPLKSLLVADVNNDSLFDLVTIDARGLLSVALNRDGKSFADAQTFQLDAPATALLALDGNEDGKLDLVYGNTDGNVTVALNTSAIGNALRLVLAGVRSAPSGRMSQLEVLSGGHYSYHQSQGGVIHAGIGPETHAEVARIEWTNGFIENKLKVDIRDMPYRFPESERISGSCPSVFAWDGEKFAYISDAFISGPMGVPMTREDYLPITDQETMVLHPGQLVARDGVMEFRFTEELLETVYLDEIELAAIDHPEGTIVAPYSRLAAPPAPGGAEYYIGGERVRAEIAVAQSGEDVTEKLAEVDGVYADVFRQNRRNVGFATPHEMTLTLPDHADPAAVDALLARGWFYYFDSTSMIGEAQVHEGNIGWPTLHQKVDGQWQPVGPVGIPSGKDKLSVMPLKGQLQSRELKYTSAIALYWDQFEFALADRTDAAEVTVLPLQEANLRFRGLSRMTQRNPELFDYHNISYMTMWNPMVGRYTAYGAVDQQVTAKDGVYAIFGTGDEIAFRFEAPSEPPAPGMQRSYLIRFDGYVKDGDRYTSDANRVDPVPFLGMVEYPAPIPAGYRNREASMLRTRQPLDYTLSITSKEWSR